jgi:hypothetical protein
MTDKTERLINASSDPLTKTDDANKTENLNYDRTKSANMMSDVQSYGGDPKENRKSTRLNAENRYGKNIKFETWKVSNGVIMATIVIGIFLIPSQLFF